MSTTKSRQGNRFEEFITSLRTKADKADLKPISSSDKWRGLTNELARKLEAQHISAEEANASFAAARKAAKI